MRDNRIDYKAVVTVGADTDFLLVTAYNIDIDKQYVGVDFHRRVMSIDDTGITIPDNRPANFKEELRCVDQASAAIKQDRIKDIQFIEQKLKEAYGGAAQVQVTKI